jgi:transposase
MRGHVDSQSPLFVVLDLERLVPPDHPLRPIKRRADELLRAMSRDFNAAYSQMGRPSIPPEQLLKALLLQALFSLRSEIALMEALRFNLLYRWFVDLPADAAVWTPECFSTNRERFAAHELLRKFFDRIVASALTQELAGSEHFSVDGTLIRSWASAKSLQPLQPHDLPAPPPEDRSNPSVDFHGEKRANDTHRSNTDPEARLARKGSGKEAHLSYSGHVLMDNRHGLCLAVSVDTADGHAERRNVAHLLRRVRARHRLAPRTLGMDSGYDDGAFLAQLETRGIVPHLPIRRGRSVAQDEAGQARRRARARQRHPSYQVSQRIRKRVEAIFGWCKTVGGLARSHFIGLKKTLQQMQIVASAYNLLRLSRLETMT